MAKQAAALPCSATVERVVLCLVFEKIVAIMNLLLFLARAGRLETATALAAVSLDKNCDGLDEKLLLPDPLDLPPLPLDLASATLLQLVTILAVLRKQPLVSSSSPFSN